MYDTAKLIPLVKAVKETTGIDSTHFKRIIAELEKPENQNPKKAKEILTEEKFGFLTSIYDKIVEHTKAIHLRSTSFTDEKTKENSERDRQACEEFLNYYHEEIENYHESQDRAHPSP